jgi:signal transduction histidine kinase
VDVRDLLSRAADAARQRAAAAGVGCEVDVPSGLTARIDPGQIRRAADNLIDNALRFAPAETQIAISARATGADLMIEVADAGPGFPDDYLPQAFERFSRPDSGRTRSDGGSGLGLSIVKAIAQAHGGRATARNQPSGGAAVRMDLPGAVEDWDQGHSDSGP